MANVAETLPLAGQTLGPETRAAVGDPDQAVRCDDPPTADESYRCSTASSIMQSSCSASSFPSCVRRAMIVPQESPSYL